MNNRNIIIGILSVLILLFAFFTIKNVRDNKARATEVDFIQQMKDQQSELTQKLQLLEDSLQQIQYGNTNSNRLVVLQKELANLELQKQSNNPELNKKIANVKQEIATVERSSAKLPQLKKELAAFQKQQKKGVKNIELDKKITRVQKEITTIEQSSAKLPQLKKELANLQQQNPSNNQELDKKIIVVQKEITTIQQSSSKLPQLKKELTILQQQQKQGVKNPELDKKIVSVKKEIATIEQSSAKLPQIKIELANLQQQKQSSGIELDKKIASVKKEIATIQQSSGSVKEQELESEIKRLETLQAQSKTKTTSSQDQEVAKLKKQIADISNNNPKSDVQSSQDREEIARLKRQLAEVSANSKNSTNVTSDDYALQIDLLKKQLIECKKNSGSSSGSSGNNQSNISSDKEQNYKQQISDLQKQLSQYTEALSTRKQEVSDNIKMLVQNIEAKGLFIDKKSNVEKETMFAGKMKSFRVSFVLISETPLDGDITLGIRIYNMADEELLKISGINEVKIDKGEDDILTCSYAQIVSARGQKKISTQKIFDASCFAELTKNAIYMIEVYTRKGVLLGTQKIKISAGEAVTTF